MGRISLEPKVQTRRIALDDDPALPTAVGQTPDIILVRRVVTGRNQAGDRVMEWVTLGTFQSVTYEERKMDRGGHELLRVKAVLVWEGDPVDATDLGFKVESFHGTEAVFKITAHADNGLRLELEGERHL